MQRKLLVSVAAALILLFAAASPSLGAMNTRAIGMGGAYIAVVNNASAAYLSPAALTILPGTEFTFQYGYGFLPDYTMAMPEPVPPALFSPTLGVMPFVAYASPESESGLSYGLFAYRAPMWGLLYYDPYLGVIEPQFALDTVIGYSLAYEILPGLSIGGAVRVGLLEAERPVMVGGLPSTYIYQYFHLGVDLGLLYHPIPQFAAAITIHDINQKRIVFEPIPNEDDVQYTDNFVTFPTRFRWGVAFMLPPFLTVAWDMTEIPQSFSDILEYSHLGGELAFNEYFALRAGLYRGTLTVGAGLTFRFADESGLRFDYAMVNNELPFRRMHYFSLSWLF